MCVCVCVCVLSVTTELLRPQYVLNQQSDHVSVKSPLSVKTSRLPLNCTGKLCIEVVLRFRLSHIRVRFIKAKASPHKNRETNMCVLDSG